ncbi:hypothetical protein V8D89_014351 [Ganoderma adspersum]
MECWMYCTYLPESIRFTSSRPPHATLLFPSVFTIYWRVPSSGSSWPVHSFLPLVGSQRGSVPVNRAVEVQFTSPCFEQSFYSLSMGYLGGGTPPYRLSANLIIDYPGSPSFRWESVLNFGTQRNLTGFEWSANMLLGSNVSFVLTDALGVQKSTPEPISCQLVFPARLVQAASASFGIVISPTSSPSEVFSSTGPSYTVFTSRGTLPQDAALGEKSIALTVLGVVIFLLLGTFPWWRSCMTIRRRDGQKADTEKQDITDSEKDERPTDRPVAPTLNPFENPENVVDTEQIFTASPVSDDGDRTPTHSPLTSSPLSTVRIINNKLALERRPRERAVSRLDRPPSVSSQPESDMRSLSDTDVARLSITTFSTLPPSYRTRRSAGSIYFPPPDYPPFPPPVYTPQPTAVPPPAPPSAFQTLRRVPPRRRPALTASKVSDTRGARSTSGEWESSRADGVRRESIRNTGGVEGSGTDEKDADAASDPSSDDRRGSPEFTGPSFEHIVRMPFILETSSSVMQCTPVNIVDCPMVVVLHEDQAARWPRGGETRRRQWGDGNGRSDCPATPATNPFDDPENLMHTEQIDIASSPTSMPGRMLDNAVPARLPPGENAVPKMERPPSVSALSDLDTRTLSDSDVARLSLLTSSTLPPSYRTRRSAGSIYIPAPDYPPFPPPVYSPQHTGAPVLPSASRTQSSGVLAPPHKGHDNEMVRTSSGDREHSRADEIRQRST